MASGMTIILPRGTPCRTNASADHDLGSSPAPYPPMPIPLAADHYSFATCGMALAHPGQRLVSSMTISSSTTPGRPAPGRSGPPPPEQFQRFEAVGVASQGSSQSPGPVRLWRGDRHESRSNGRTDNIRRSSSAGVRPALRKWRFARARMAAGPNETTRSDGNSELNRVAKARAPSGPRRKSQRPRRHQMST